MNLCGSAGTSSAREETRDITDVTGILTCIAESAIMGFGRGRGLRETNLRLQLPCGQQVSVELRQNAVSVRGSIKVHRGSTLKAGTHDLYFDAQRCRDSGELKDLIQRKFPEIPPVKSSQIQHATSTQASASA